ncbi:hypothetical protein CGMCC3_g15554 [Colletotrichum fructicola]|nr:uncharacterized protein CGMCC3_g15554 [Colletotrichum fructicola]KAE9568314.1 hypothetical protein CGMCC3_g15554 [Colletotrichum fructicola]
MAAGLRREARREGRQERKGPASKWKGGVGNDARKSRDLELHCLDDPSNIGRPQEGGQCSAGAVEKIENERILDAGYDHCTSTG